MMQYTWKEIRCGWLAAFLLFACQPLSQTSQQPSPAPRVTERPQVLYNNYPDPSPTPWVSAVPTPAYTQPPHYPPVIPPPDYVDLKIPDPLGYQNYYCEPLPKSPILKYPTDVAVTVDGNTIYAINSGCNRTINNGIFLVDILPNCAFSEPAFPQALKRQLLFRIQNGKAEQILNESHQEKSCMMGYDLEIDSFDQLYLVNLHQNKIEKLNSALKFTSILTNNEISEAGDPLGCCAPKAKHTFPPPYGLQLRLGQLYFHLYAGSSASDYRLRKLDVHSGKSQDLIALMGFELSSQQPLYTFVGGKAYRLWSENGIEIGQPQTYQDILKNHNTFTVKGLFELQESELSKSKLPIKIPFTFTQRPPLIQLYELRAASADLFYLSDVKNHQIWVIRLKPDHSEGSLTVLAGSGQKGYQDGQGRAASFYLPTALSLDGVGNLYVADTGNHAIRKITPGGTVSTVYKAPESELKPEQGKGLSGQDGQ